MLEITKDADKLICTLYKEYLDRNKSGLSKRDSSYFGDSNAVQERYFPKWDSEDVSDMCWQLCRVELLYCSPGDDLANNIQLTDTAIVYMENRFKNGIKDVLIFLSNFIP